MSKKEWLREKEDFEKPIEHHGKPSIGHSVMVKVRGLAQGDNPVSFTFDAGRLDYPTFRGEGAVKGMLRRDGERLELQAEVSAEGEFECTRCAEPFRERISAPLQLHFVPPRLEQNAGDPNVQAYDPVATTEIDILRDIRDALILAIPMQHLCRPDCKGLCPICGKDRNRESCTCTEAGETVGGWTALKGLSERLRAEENKVDDRSSMVDDDHPQKRSRAI